MKRLILIAFSVILASLLLTGDLYSAPFLSPVLPTNTPAAPGQAIPRLPGEHPVVTATPPTSPLDYHAFRASKDAMPMALPQTGGDKTDGVILVFSVLLAALVGFGLGHYTRTFKK